MTVENSFHMLIGVYLLLFGRQVYNWTPQPFDNTTLEGDLGREASKRLGDRFNPDYIGISCEGEVSFTFCDLVGQLSSRTFI